MTGGKLGLWDEGVRRLACMSCRDAADSSLLDSPREGNPLRFAIRRLGGPLSLAVAIVVCATPALAQQDVDGVWLLEVITDNGVTTPTVTFEQDGEMLTGQYSSETLGQASVRGTVIDRDVMFSFFGDVQGQEIPVVYRGTVDEDGRMTGTLDIADGMLTGAFTATRNSP